MLAVCTRREEFNPPLCFLQTDYFQMVPSPEAFKELIETSSLRFDVFYSFILLSLFSHFIHRRRQNRLVAELHFRWENTCAALQKRRPTPAVLMEGVSMGDVQEQIESVGSGRWKQIRS